MYLTEISPANLRGAIGSFAQLFLTIAILFSQILGLPVLLGTPDLWQWIFGFSIVREKDRTNYILKLFPLKGARHCSTGYTSILSRITKIQFGHP
jgi:MFS family permease